MILKVSRGRNIAAAAMLGIMVSGCGTLTDLTKSDSIDYRGAKQGPTLEVPPDLTQLPRDDRYAIPRSSTSATQAAAAQKQAQSARSAAGGVLPQPANARIVRQGDQRWLQVDQPAEEVWPVVRQFWMDLGFALTTDSPESGILETDWAENRAKIQNDIIRRTLGKIVDSLYSTGERDKFRVRLERNGNSTEVHVTHRGMMEVWRDERVKDQTLWQPRPADPNLEAEFLQRILAKFSVVTEQAKAQAAEQGGGAAGSTQVRLIQSGQDPRLEYAGAFDRAWRSVGVGVDRAGFTVEDRDRAKGIFFVRYRDDTSGGRAEAARDQKKGFLSRFFSNDEVDDAKTRQLRIVVAGERDRSNIYVQDNAGKAVAPELANRVLKILADNMR